MTMLIRKKIRQRRFIKYFGLYIIKTCRFLFPVSVITFIVYFILENIKTGLISNYFDLNKLLLLAIVSGSFLIFFDQRNKNPRFEVIKLIMTLVLVVAVIVLTYQYLQNIGKMRYFISPAAGLILYLILNININKND